MKLEDVIYDVKYLMFEDLKFQDLLSLAQTSRHFSALSEEIFVRKHSNNLLRLSPARGHVCNLYDLTDHIIVKNPDTILEILKKFGHLIKRIQLILEFYPNENITELSRSINSHCADTLIEIDIESSYKDLFEGMTKPFRQLEVFSMEGSVESLGSNTLRFNELFPALRRLKLGAYLQIFNQSSIDVHFAHLEYLYLSVLNTGGVEEFLRKNPRIQSVVLHNANRRILELISQTLPNIANLRLLLYKDNTSNGNSEIIFETVTSFTTYELPQNRFQNITFRSLTELHTTISVYPFSAVQDLVEFVKNNPQLKRVFIDSGVIYHENIHPLLKARLNIEEITLPAINVDERHIMRFMRNCEHMKKVTFKDGINIGSLGGQLETKWIITSYNKALVFTRRE